MKPLISEMEILTLVDGKDLEVYMVQAVEDVVADYIRSSPVTASSFTDSEIISIVEPQDTKGKDYRVIYQLRAGIEIGRVYTELLSGHLRRVPFTGGRPSASNPNVGYFDEVMSPYSSPRFEFFAEFNAKPSLMFYNEWPFSITPRMMWRGRKLKLFPLDGDRGNISDETAASLRLSKEELARICGLVMSGKYQQRRVTQLGIDR